MLSKGQSPDGQGLASWKLIVKYPVPVAINLFLSGMVTMLPALLSGSVIMSMVLSLPTLGLALLNTLEKHDEQCVGAIIEPL